MEEQLDTIEKTLEWLEYEVKRVKALYLKNRDPKYRQQLTELQARLNVLSKENSKYL